MTNERGEAPKRDSYTKPIDGTYKIVNAISYTTITTRRTIGLDTCASRHVTGDFSLLKNTYIGESMRMMEVPKNPTNTVN